MLLITIMSVANSTLDFITITINYLNTLCEKLKGLIISYVNNYCKYLHINTRIKCLLKHMILNSIKLKNYSLQRFSVENGT